MTTASLELCKELYLLSKWVGTDFYHDASEGWDDQHVEYGGGSLPKDGGIYPAYDLGYILRKLPNRSPKTQIIIMLDGDWFANYGDVGVSADTPENAAVKLAILLIKEGIIKP